MEYEIEPLFAAIVDAVASEGPFAERMAQVIGECERQIPHRGWQKMRRIAFDQDEGALETWLPTTIEGLAPGTAIRGLWFGLNNPVIKGATTADVYIGASESHEADSLDWATELIELPGRAYLRSRVLDSIYREAYGREGGLGNEAEYPLVLTYGCLCALEVLERTVPAGALKGLKGAACGFDSGDGLQLGRFSGKKFVRNVEST